MIKRRFFKIDHGDRDAANASSSSSDSEIEAGASEESEDDEMPEVKQDDEAGSTSSGYESDDSSVKDVDLNTSGLLVSEDDAGTTEKRQTLTKRELSSDRTFEVLEKSKVLVEKKPLPTDMSSYILKCKSVFKCRVCPRVICLTDDTLRDHLQSKRHARSEKLLSEGRLKTMLNSDGETEEVEVSEIEMKDSKDDTKKELKEQKQKKKKKLRKKKSDNPNTKKLKSTEGPAKRR